MHIADLDMTLVEDGTYVVHEAGDEVVACGGWSQRDKLYTGSGTAADDAHLLDPATEPARVRAMFVRATGRGAGWAGRSSSRASVPPALRASRSSL